MISSMPALLLNDTYAKLAKLQADCDAVDPVMRAYPFSRSPYHILAFIVSYIAASEGNREKIIENLNNLAEARQADPAVIFTLEQFRILNDLIDWEAFLLSQAATAAGAGAGDGASSAHPFDFTVEILTSNPTAFFKAIETRSPKLSAALRHALSAIKVKPVPEEDEVISIVTTVSENKTWVKPFTFQEEADGYCIFNVPYGDISDALSKKLEAFPESSVQNIGCFAIKVVSGSMRNSVYFNVKVPSVQTSLSLSGRTFSYHLAPAPQQTGKGIYHALEGLENHCGLGVVGDIIVKLISEGKFTREGAGVKQTQAVECHGFAMSSGTPSTITVMAPLGVLFSATGIAVNFASGTAADLSAYAVCPPENIGCYARLYTNDAKPVHIYPFILQGRSAHDELINSARIYSSTQWTSNRPVHQKFSSHLLLPAASAMPASPSWPMAMPPQLPKGPPRRIPDCPDTISAHPSGRSPWAAVYYGSDIMPVVATQPAPARLPAANASSGLNHAQPEDPSSMAHIP